MSRCAGVISGNMILLCLLIALSVQPPNQRVQSTPLRGPEIVAILKADFGWMATLIYRCGAADAQHVGRARCSARSCCTRMVVVWLIGVDHQPTDRL
jgi:hypothetical protein